MSSFLDVCKLIIDDINCHICTANNTCYNFLVSTHVWILKLADLIILQIHIYSISLHCLHYSKISHIMKLGDNLRFCPFTLICPFDLKFYSQSLIMVYNALISCISCLMTKLYLIQHRMSYNVKYIAFSSLSICYK